MASAEVSGILNKRLYLLLRIDLLIIDELGYLTINNQTAMLPFQLVSKHYRKGSLFVTTNKPFEQWGEIFTDDVVADAVFEDYYIIRINSL